MAINTFNLNIFYGCPAGVRSMTAFYCGKPVETNTNRGFRGESYISIALHVNHLLKVPFVIINNE